MWLQRVFWVVGLGCVVCAASTRTQQPLLSCMAAYLCCNQTQAAFSRAWQFCMLIVALVCS